MPSFRQKHRHYLVFWLLPILVLVSAVGFPLSLFAVPAKGHKIMVAGPSPDSIEIAQKIHSKGGNVVDVTVAVALGLAVTHPYYAAFGGGGFAMIRIGKETRVLDFREIAPAASNPDLFKNLPTNASLDGGLAAGIPGVPAGLWELHKTYGKLKWSKLFEEAITLAEKGFRVSGEWSEVTAQNKSRFNDAGRTIFFGKDGRELKPGEVLKQPALGKLLREMRARGPRAFYEGPVAKDLVDTVNKTGGIWSLQDLKNYRVRWLEPLTAEFSGHTLYLMPPPSSGGIVISQALRLMELTKLTEKEPLSVDEFHLLAEIMKLSYRGRSLLGDPDFTKNPIEELRSEKYLAPLAAKIRMDRALDVEPLKNLSFEKENTTHFSVMDSKGDTVAFTVTLNGFYGSAVVTPKYGIALNNEMDDFTTKPGQPNLFGLIQGEANKVQPGARPLSSMSPTIAVKDGKTVLSIGAPGGPRIISGVLQASYRILAQSFNVEQAIYAPRVHHQFLPNKLFTDTLRLSPETIAALKKKGHQVEFGSTAKVYGITLDENGILSAAADHRGEGAAGGM